MKRGLALVFTLVLVLNIARSILIPDGCWGHNGVCDEAGCRPQSSAFYTYYFPDGSTSKCGKSPNLIHYYSPGDCGKPPISTNCNYMNPTITAYKSYSTGDCSCTCTGTLDCSKLTTNNYARDSDCDKSPVCVETCNWLGTSCNPCENQGGANCGDCTANGNCDDDKICPGCSTSCSTRYTLSGSHYQVGNANSCYYYDPDTGYYYDVTGVYKGAVNAQTLCVSTGAWAIGGEVSPTTCCGDDSGENVCTENTYSQAIAFDNNEQACCDAADDCVAGGSCYTSYGNYNTAGIMSGLNPGGNDNIAYCYDHGSVGEWLDCDQDDYMDFWCGTICGPKKGQKALPRGLTNDWNAVYAGESGVGEYPDTNTLGCCGDDVNEYYKEGPDGTSACCDSGNDCVYDSKCYSEGAKITGVGTCNSGSWGACKTDSACQLGFYCAYSNTCEECDDPFDCYYKTNCRDGNYCCDINNECNNGYCDDGTSKIPVRVCRTPINLVRGVIDTTNYKTSDAGPSNDYHLDFGWEVSLATISDACLTFSHTNGPFDVYFNDVKIAGTDTGISDYIDLSSEALIGDNFLLFDALDCGTTSNCPNYYNILIGYLKSESGVSSGTSACCDEISDCVDDSNCYNDGSIRDVNDDGVTDYCDAGLWIGQDDSQVFCENQDNVWLTDECCGDGVNDNFKKEAGYCYQGQDYYDPDDLEGVCLLDDLTNVWVESQCCGDDAAADNFFLNDQYCYDGIITEPDSNVDVCLLNPENDWLTGNVIDGTTGSCCGDDGANDNFCTTEGCCGNGLIVLSPEDSEVSCKNNNPANEWFDKYIGLETDITKVSDESFNNGFIADVNGDGLKDLVVGGDRIVWFENLGNGLFWSEAKLIADYPVCKDCFKIGDVNGDNLVDVVATDQKEIVWFKNLGGSFSNSQLIDSGLNLKGLAIGDLENNNYLDIIAYSDKTIYYWFNNEWLRYSINPSLSDFNPAIHQLSIGDINGDQFNDIIFSYERIYYGYHYPIIWLKNNHGSFSDSQQLSDDYFRLFDVGDIDGDGDLDLLGFGQLLWIENDGTSTDWVRNWIHKAPYSGGKLVDIDLDNDLDFFANYHGNIYLRLNNDLTFKNYFINDEGFNSIITGELDSDSYPEIVLIKSDSVEVANVREYGGCCGNDLGEEVFNTTHYCIDGVVSETVDGEFSENACLWNDNHRVWDSSNAWFDGQCCGNDDNDNFYNVDSSSYCVNGVFYSEPDDLEDVCLLENSNNVWFTGTVSDEVLGPCCGDDGTSDTFYDENLFCVNGLVVSDADGTPHLCKDWGYYWMTGIDKCCGDDKDSTDLLYNGTYYCYYDYLVEDGDYNQEVCELNGEWINSAVPTSQGLVSYWRFDEIQKEVITDSNKYINGYLKNTEGDEWVDGYQEKAFDFDGDNDYIQLEDNDELKITNNPFTVSLWFKADDVNKNSILINNLDYCYGLSLKINQGKIQYSTHQYIDSYGHINRLYSFNEITFEDIAQVQVGQWYNVIFVFNENGAQAWLNGGRVLTNGIQNFGYKDSQCYYPWSIGNRLDGTSPGDYYFDGLIDEIRMYNRALTETEVKEIYYYGLNDYSGPCCGDDGTNDNFCGQGECCVNGELTGEIDIDQTLCEEAGFNWLTKPITGLNGQCCGDDLFKDEFYNGLSFCSSGQLVNDGDFSQFICEALGKTWFTGTVSDEVLGACCGDDGVSDVFYNGSLYCYQGQPTIDGDASPETCLWNNSNNKWFDGQCCGDDGTSDNFYEGAIGSATKFCHQGTIVNGEIDELKIICEANNFKWFYPSLTGNFELKKIISNSAYKAVLTDVDVDGDLDIVGSNGLWWENNYGELLEAKTYGGPSLDFDEAEGTERDDINHDGVIDEIYFGGCIRWKDGKTGEIYYIGASYGMRINCNFQLYNDFDLIDIDRDGDKDLIYFDNQKLYWLKKDRNCYTNNLMYINYNKGQSVYNDYCNPQFLFETLSPMYPGGDLDVFDFDSDGDLDIIYTSYLGLTLLRNDYGYKGIVDGSSPDFTEIILNPYRDFNDISSGDLSGDGIAEFVTHYNGDLVVFEQPLTGDYLIGSSCCGDDGFTDYFDNFTDTCYHKVDIEELKAYFDGAGLITQEFDIENVVVNSLGDFEDDGDIDLILGLKNSGDVFWLENNKYWFKHFVGTIDNLLGVNVANLDNQQGLDIVAFNKSGVYWWFNNGREFINRQSIEGLSNIKNVIIDDVFESKPTDEMLIIRENEPLMLISKDDISFSSEVINNQLISDFNQSPESLDNSYYGTITPFDSDIQKDYLYDNNLIVSYDLILSQEEDDQHQRVTSDYPIGRVIYSRKVGGQWYSTYRDQLGVEPSDFLNIVAFDNEKGYTSNYYSATSIGNDITLWEIEDFDPVYNLPVLVNRRDIGSISNDDVILDLVNFNLDYQYLDDIASISKNGKLTIWSSEYFNRFDRLNVDVDLPNLSNITFFYNHDLILGFNDSIISFDVDNQLSQQVIDWANGGETHFQEDFRDGELIGEKYLFFNPGINIQSSLKHVFNESDKPIFDVSSYDDVRPVDFDFDGDVDFVISKSNGDVFVKLNNNGVFTEQLLGHQESMKVVSIEPGDFNNDGYMDLVTANYYPNSLNRIYYWENDGSNKFTKKEISPSLHNLYNLFSVDIDGDGDLDIFTQNNQCINEGGSFTCSELSFIPASSSDITTGYFNDDDLLDFAVIGNADDHGSNILLEFNDGAGGFNSRELFLKDFHVTFISAADFDGDGDSDIFYSGEDFESYSKGLESSYFGYLVNNGKASFKSKKIDTSNMDDIIFADIQNDGFLDIFTHDDHDDYIFWENKNGGLIKHLINVNYYDGLFLRPASFMDFDGDGDLDIIFSGFSRKKASFIEQEEFLVKDSTLCFWFYPYSLDTEREIYSSTNNGYHESLSIGADDSLIYRTLDKAYVSSYTITEDLWNFFCLKKSYNVEEKDLTVNLSVQGFTIGGINFEGIEDGAYAEDYDSFYLGDQGINLLVGRIGDAYVFNQFLSDNEIGQLLRNTALLPNSQAFKEIDYFTNKSELCFDSETCGLNTAAETAGKVRAFENISNYYGLRENHYSVNTGGNYFFSNIAGSGGFADNLCYNSFVDESKDIDLVVVDPDKDIDCCKKDNLHWGGSNDFSESIAAGDDINCCGDDLAESWNAPTGCCVDSQWYGGNACDCLSDDDCGSDGCVGFNVYRDYSCNGNKDCVYSDLSQNCFTCGGSIGCPTTVNGRDVSVECNDQITPEEFVDNYYGKDYNSWASNFLYNGQVWDAVILNSYDPPSDSFNVDLLNEDNNGNIIKESLGVMVPQEDLWPRCEYVKSTINCFDHVNGNADYRSAAYIYSFDGYNWELMASDSQVYESTASSCFIDTAQNRFNNFLQSTTLFDGTIWDGEFNTVDDALQKTYFVSNILSFCGDYTCDLTENCFDCPADCPDCSNDGFCSSSENCNNDPADCPDCSNDGYCDALSEDCCVTSDCSGVCVGYISKNECCGDGICNILEKFNNNCRADCPI